MQRRELPVDVGPVQRIPKGFASQIHSLAVPAEPTGNRRRRELMSTRPVVVTQRSVPSYSAEAGFWAMSPYSHEASKGEVSDHSILIVDVE